MPGHSDTPKNVNICLFGADWCGYTRKQKEALQDQLDQDHATYVDCEKSDHAVCQQVRGYPHTIVHEGSCQDIQSVQDVPPGQSFSGFQPDTAKITDVFKKMCQE